MMMMMMMIIIIIHILSIYYPCSDHMMRFFFGQHIVFSFPKTSRHFSSPAGTRVLQADRFFLGEATRKGLKTSWLPSGNGKSTINDDLMVGFLWLMMISWDLMGFHGISWD